MRLTERDKALNRAKILETAGALFRERGIDAVSVTEVMAAAGFTHGGFYNHFESKEALAAEVCAHDQGSANTAMEHRFGGPDAARQWRRYIEGYLSVSNRDNPAHGCTLSAFVGQATRQPKEIQECLTQGHRVFVKLMAKQYERQGAKPDQALQQALSSWSQMLGAITLSRSLVETDRKMADEVLVAARRSVLASFEAE